MLREREVTPEWVGRRLLETQRRRFLAPAEAKQVLVPTRFVRRIRAHVRSGVHLTGQFAGLLTRMREPFFPYVLQRARTLDDPFPFYRRLQRTPLCWDSLLNSWVVTGYDATAALLAHPGLSADRMGHVAPSPPPQWERGFNTLDGSLALQVLFQDGSTHRELRQKMARAFTPRVIAEMEAQVERTANRLLEGVQSARQMDLISAFAFPLPATVIAGLLGVPDDDIVTFKSWSDEMVRYISEGGTLAQDLQAREGALALGRYFYRLLQERRTAPDDSLLSQGSARPGGLTEEEIIANCLLLLTAGHETTTNLIGNGMLALFQNPAQRAYLEEDLDHRLPNAVEEMLRYDGPVQWTSRVAREIIETGTGQTIQRGQRGQRVIFGFPAANRDPARFPRPDRLDLSRQDGKHLSFGYGPHFCLGAAMARREGQVSFRLLLRRLPCLRLQFPDRAPRWRRNLTFRALKELPVTWD